MGGGGGGGGVKAPHGDNDQYTINNVQVHWWHQQTGTNNPL